MGYTTDFNGQFKFNKKLDAKTQEFLTKFSETRRMARNVKGYGVEGEFFVDGSGYAGQGDDANIIDYNTPPKTQPGLWCNWTPTEDGKFLEWNGGEKFYNYIEWLKYLIEFVLIPRGYSITGSVQWFGEDREDFGVIHAINNVLTISPGFITYGKATNWMVK